MSISRGQQRLPKLVATRLKMTGLAKIELKTCTERKPMIVYGKTSQQINVQADF